jgi:hypothetical protein
MMLIAMMASGAFLAWSARRLVRDDPGDGYF